MAFATSRRATRREVAWAAALLLAATARAQAPPREAGQRLYEALCSRCHGIEGVGGQGPALRQPVLRQAPDDEALRGIILGGIPGAGMPSIIGSATPTELNQLVAYVRALGRRPAETVDGSPTRGREVFTGAESAGAVVAGVEASQPDLTVVGLSRGARCAPRCWSRARLPGARA
jgi:mono/diheme cytochrome c family protein